MKNEHGFAGFNNARLLRVGFDTRFFNMQHLPFPFVSSVCWATRR